MPLIDLHRIRNNGVGEQTSTRIEKSVNAHEGKLNGPQPTADGRYDNRLAKKLPFADAFSVSISRPGGFPKKRLYSRLNWLGLS